MAGQEKSFKDLQQDERLKRLERQLKLTQMKRLNSSQQSPSTRMSISAISSIHEDNPFSDLSIYSSQASSSRAESVILASSLNLQKKLYKNLKNHPNALFPTTSSVFEQSSERQDVDKDRVMMPPPEPAALNSHKAQTSDKAKKIGRATGSMTKRSHLQNYESGSHSADETYRSVCNLTVEGESLKELSMSHNTTKQQGRAWRNWIVRLNTDGQIIVRGKLESGDYGRSKAIKKRLSATTVLSVLNHPYHLVGDIHDVQEELPAYIRGKFYNGFPTDWENVRQVWQGYVVSGYSLSYRWPTPMADSDDDLRSDITDLTNCRSKNPKITPASFVSSPTRCPDSRKTDRSICKEETPKRQKVTHSEVPSLELKEIERKASCGNAYDRTAPVPSNHSNHDSAIGNTQSPSCGRIPKCKIDIIVDNLINKNCSIELVEKFITAINCFNELLALPPTVNAETAPDEGVFLNYNSNSQTDKSNNETLKHVEPSGLQCRREAAAGLLNSYSLDSIDSEEEQSTKHTTFVCNKFGKTLPPSTLVRVPSTESNTRYLEQKEKQSTPTLSREEVSKRANIKNQHKQRPIFETTDTDGETVVPDQGRPIPRRVRHQLVATEKNNIGVEESKSGACSDSDVSIVETLVTPSKRHSTSGNDKRKESLSKRIHGEERQRPNSSCTNNETNDHSRATPMPKISANLSDEQTLDSSAVKLNDKCRVQVTRSAIDQHKRTRSSSTLSKSEKTPSRSQVSRKNIDPQTNGQPKNDSESDMRKSSRDRVEPLRYWEGERRSLKGGKLVYSPGTDRLRSTSANSSALRNTLISSNRTAVSEPGFSAAARNLNETPTGSRERSKSRIKSTGRSGGVLLEISPNCDGNNDDYFTLSDQRTKRTPRTAVPEDMKKHRRSRRIREKSDSSSDDEKIPAVPVRKRQRVW